MAAFKQSRTLKPERFVNDKLIEATENEDSLENIEELTYSFVNRHAQSRMKQMIKEKVDPVRQSYDAVMNYKGKVERVLKDPFLIYKVDCKEQIVFKQVRNSYNLHER